MNLSIVASVGRYVMRNFMFLYSISAGSGLRTFIMFADADDIVASAAETTRTAARQGRFGRCTRRTAETMLDGCGREQPNRRHCTTMWANSATADKRKNTPSSVCLSTAALWAGISPRATQSSTGWSVIYIFRRSLAWRPQSPSTYGTDRRSYSQNWEVRTRATGADCTR